MRAQLDSSSISDGGTARHRLDALMQINLDDLVSSFGWDGQRLLSFLLRRLFSNAARKFAKQMLEFDDAVGRYAELADASRLMLRTHYVRALRVEGREHVPRHGPVLFLSNHPGMADTISLFAAIDRPDLKIVALRRPFLASLENVAQRIFFVDENLGKRVIAAHEVAAHLRGGGAALTFPAGRIEPDPDRDSGAIESVAGWADSARFIVRFAPETKIVPVLVRGVVWKRTAQHWLTRLKRTRFEREKLAAALQLLAMVSRDVRPTSVNVRFAAPISPLECNVMHGGAIQRIVVARMRELITDVPGPQTAAYALAHPAQCLDG